jgi:hypothetical protein
VNAPVVQQAATLGIVGDRAPAAYRGSGCGIGLMTRCDQRGISEVAIKPDLVGGLMHAFGLLSALRRKFVARQANGKRLDVDKNHPRLTDEPEPTEEAIEEAQRRPEDEIDPETQAAIQRAQRRAEDEIDPETRGDHDRIEASER